MFYFNKNHGLRPMFYQYKSPFGCIKRTRISFSFKEPGQNQNFIREIHFRFLPFLLSNKFFAFIASAGWLNYTTIRSENFKRDFFYKT